MSAYVDRDQTVKFFYGNAFVELNDFLPPDESTSAQHKTAPDSPLASLEATLSSVENLLTDLKTSQREVSYLMSDLGRLIKKI